MSAVTIARTTAPKSLANASFQPRNRTVRAKVSTPSSGVERRNATTSAASAPRALREWATGSTPHAQRGNGAPTNAPRTACRKLPPRRRPVDGNAAPPKLEERPESEAQHQRRGRFQQEIDERRRDRVTERHRVDLSVMVDAVGHDQETHAQENGGHLERAGERRSLVKRETSMNDDVKQEASRGRGYPRLGSGEQVDRNHVDEVDGHQRGQSEEPGPNYGARQPAVAAKSDRHNGHEWNGVSPDSREKIPMRVPRVKVTGKHTEGHAVCELMEKERPEAELEA